MTSPLPNGPSDEDRRREPYRWCVYCNADCQVDEPEHSDDCPSNTGVYPIRKSDVVCMDCGEPFQIGDFYTHREVESGAIGQMDTGLPLEHAKVGEVICLGCAAKEVAGA